MLSHFNCVQFFGTPWTVAHQVPLSMGILQARILEWGAMPASRGSSRPRDGIPVSCTGRWVLYHWSTWKAQDLYSTARTHQLILLSEIQMFLLFTFISTEFHQADFKT